MNRYSDGSNLTPTCPVAQECVIVEIDEIWLKIETIDLNETKDANENSYQK
jgi:hypothetical protein